jgi:hypothetical protein
VFFFVFGVWVFALPFALASRVRERPGAGADGGLVLVGVVIWSLWVFY